MTHSDKNIKEKIKERYGKITVFGNSDSCCMPSGCCGPENDGDSQIYSAKAIGYGSKELAALPSTSILMEGCVNLQELPT
jgi:hypothetical protein